MFACHQILRQIAANPIQILANQGPVSSLIEEMRRKFLYPWARQAQVNIKTTCLKLIISFIQGYKNLGLISSTRLETGSRFADI